MVDNVAPKQAWEAVVSHPQAQIVDVRTDAEWAFVGVPDLAEAGKQAVLLSWQAYPSMGVNAGFMDQLKQAGFTPDNHIYFLCRSGGRSMAAAQLAQSQGFPNVYNIMDGFEGNPDGHGHRGTTGGWKAEGLPWRQR